MQTSCLFRALTTYYILRLCENEKCKFFSLRHTNWCRIYLGCLHRNHLDNKKEILRIIVMQDQCRADFKTVTEIRFRVLTIQINMVLTSMQPLQFVIMAPHSLASFFKHINLISCRFILGPNLVPIYWRIL